MVVRLRKSLTCRVILTADVFNHDTGNGYASASLTTMHVAHRSPIEAQRRPSFAKSVSRITRGNVILRA